MWHVEMGALFQKRVSKLKSSYWFRVKYSATIKVIPEKPIPKYTGQVVHYQFVPHLGIWAPAFTVVALGYRTRNGQEVVCGENPYTE